MSLTLGTGPLKRGRAGTFNFDIDAASPQHIIYIEAVPQRIRAVFNGETILDTRGAKVLYESNIMGQWYFPSEDVRSDLLTPTKTSTHCPFKGDASYWTLTAGDRAEPDVVWAYPAPLDDKYRVIEQIAGMQAFYFGRMDVWLEEDEPVFGYARDPYHRCDARRTSDQVTVRVNGEVVAESGHAVKVFETSISPRWYLPIADVTAEALAPSATTTVCPYKGTASYFTVAGVADGAWVYQQPFPEMSAIAGMLSFDGAGVEVSVLPGA